MNDSYQVNIEERDNSAIIRPEGDVDMGRSPALREAIRSVQGGAAVRIVVDLASVGYMDSSGLATLVEAMKLTRNAKKALVLCAMNDRVRAIFEIAKLDQYFTITTDLAAALDV